MSSADATHISEHGNITGVPFNPTVIGAVGINFSNHNIEFYVAPSTEGEKKGAEFGRKYFGTIGEKVFGTLGYVFGPADEKK